MNAWDEIVRNDVDDVLQEGERTDGGDAEIRPWPPVMIRDFMHAYDLSTRQIEDDTTIGYVADYLSETPGASVSVYGSAGNFMGIAVDEDVMALIKRDGVRALDYPITEAIQRGRPVCSITDSPLVILQMMRDKGWDRVGVRAHGRVIGTLRRRDLVRYAVN